MSKSYHLKAQRLMESKSKSGWSQRPVKIDGIDSRSHKKDYIAKRNTISESLTQLENLDYVKSI